MLGFAATSTGVEWENDKDAHHITLTLYQIHVYNTIKCQGRFFASNICIFFMGQSVPILLTFILTGGSSRHSM